METVFLACFAFGALFTVASVAVGAVSSTHGADAGQGTDGGHGGQLGDGGHTADGGSGLAHGGAAVSGHGHDTGAPLIIHKASPLAALGRLPVFNVSSAVAFLTWFGAAGYLLLRFAAWPALVVLVGAIAAGCVG
ncbi:MAG: hypothetical protein ACRDI2_23470, partial [Chloroflexota bacterium]